MAKYLESEYLEPCQRIWEGYKVYASGASVIRKGFENVGAAIRTNDSLNFASTFFRRSESDLEHQAKTAWLASVFMSNFPTYFGGERFYTVPFDIWLRITVALTHDAGEFEIGDILDDGNPKHDTKNKAELAAFRKLLIAYSPTAQREVFELYKAFQKKDTREAMALVALDKTEAILTNLFLESKGIHGRISAKSNPTELDKHYAELIGSDRAADVWYMHMLEHSAKGFLPDIMEPVVTLLNVAARDVRGEDSLKFTG